MNVIHVQHTETLICIIMLQIHNNSHLPVLMLQIYTVSFSHCNCGRPLEESSSLWNNIITGLRFFFESQGFEPIQSIPTPLPAKAGEKLFGKLIYWSPGESPFYFAVREYGENDADRQLPTSLGPLQVMGRREEDCWGLAASSSEFFSLQ